MLPAQETGEWIVVQGNVESILFESMTEGDSAMGAIARATLSVSVREVVSASDELSRKTIRTDIDVSALFYDNESLNALVNATEQDVLIRLVPVADDGWELDAIGCISMIFGSLKRNGHFSSEIKIGKKNDFAEKVINYISENFAAPITSTSAATSLFMNNSYFCRTFKKSFGCCFSDYVLAYRLEKAKIFLANTADTVTEISLKTGFNSSSYFSKAFREHFGESPLSYRKREAQK
jgi:AraC-like DNA-binding protein